MKREETGAASQLRVNGAGELSTRERILTLLKTGGRMNAGQLAQALDLTEMAIRRHMYALEKDGSVCTVSIRQAMGRPLHAYELTKQSDELFPKNYHTLTLDLLDELADDPEAAMWIDRMFEGRKRKLLARYEARMADKSLGERVQELAAIQNAGGYMVKVEPLGEDGYELNEYNCPIAQVASQYGQACQCELALFRALLKVPVERVECLAKGGGKCSYRIG